MRPLVLKISALAACLFMVSGCQRDLSKLAAQENSGGEAQLSGSDLKHMSINAVKTAVIHDAISGSMLLQCQRYFPGRNFLNCVPDSLRMSNALDYRFISNSENESHAAFVADLVWLLESPESIGRAYLTSLEKGVSEASLRGEKFYLWNWTLSYTNGYAPLALKLIAVLLQDTGTQNWPVSFVRMHPKLGQEPARILKNTLDVIRDSKAFEPLPPLAGSVKGQFYHFYVIAYAAFKMNAAGSSRQGSFFMPFIFNTSYEISQKHESNGTPSHNFIPSWLAGKNQGLQKFNLLTNRLSQKIDPFERLAGGIEHDSYLGYAGAFFGTFLAEKRSWQDSITPVKPTSFSTALSGKGGDYIKRLTEVINTL